MTMACRRRVAHRYDMQHAGSAHYPITLTRHLHMFARLIRLLEIARGVFTLLLSVSSHTSFRLRPSSEPQQKNPTLDCDNVGQTSPPVSSKSLEKRLDAVV